jgi:hypothetical protein
VRGILWTFGMSIFGLTVYSVPRIMYCVMPSGIVLEFAVAISMQFTAYFVLYDIDYIRELTLHIALLR